MPSSSRPQQKLKPAFNRGWTAQQKAMMEAVVLPERLRCYDCSKLTNVSGFSEKQCKDLRYGMITRQVNAAKLGEEAWLRCRKCTGVQPTEMECMLCGLVKGYDDFAKSQRKNRDRATCLLCSWHVEHERIIGNTAADAYAASQDDNTEEESYDDGSVGLSNAYEDSEDNESETGGAPLSSLGLTDANLKSLDISTSGRSSRPSGSMASKTMSGGKSRATPEAGDMEGLNLWKAMSKKHGGSVADSTSGARFTGFDPEGGSHQKFRAPSTVASDDSEETTTADDSYDYKAEKEARSKFAKERGMGRQVPKPEPTKSGRILPARQNSDDEETDEEYFTI